MLKYLKDMIKAPDSLVLRNHREQEKSQMTEGQTPSLLSKELERWSIDMMNLVLLSSKNICLC